MNQLCCSQDICGRPERSPCCEGEYIIERVIGKNRQKCCYQGILPIENSGTFCPPLFLKEIEVIDIATICPAQPCSCGTQQLRLTLLLRSIDGRGCRFQSLRSVKGQTDRRYVKQMYDVAQRYASDALSFVRRQVLMWSC